MKGKTKLCIDWVGLLTHLRATVEEDFVKAKVLADQLIRLCNSNPHHLMAFLGTEDVVMVVPKSTSLVKTTDLNYSTKSTEVGDIMSAMERGASIKIGHPYNTLYTPVTDNHSLYNIYDLGTLPPYPHRLNLTPTGTITYNDLLHTITFRHKEGIEIEEVTAR